MNKKQFAILSVGNISNKDEGIAIYASKYLEINYSIEPQLDIIHGGDQKSLLDTFMQYDEILVLDAIGIDDTAGSLFNFPMSQFRSLSTKDDLDETGVLGCLNILEKKGESLPSTSLLAIIPEAIEEKIGLSDSLSKPFEAYILMITKELESRVFKCELKEETQTIETIIKSFNS